MKTRRRLCAVITAIAVCGVVSAHHSFAMFDIDVAATISGTVTEFQWTNPHSWIELDAAAAGGGTDHYSIEAGSLVGLKRQGWSNQSIKPGDKITVRFHPLRDGRHGGSLMGVRLADGKVFGTME